MLLTDLRLSDPLHQLLQELPTADEGADALFQVLGGSQLRCITAVSTSCPPTPRPAGNTATEIALLVLAGSGATSGLPW
ncbi:hypothetical protein [Streptomyces sp. NPDC015125]|uniref:hypothetical protein n=1 Tax=Streptomyces sp. NPDC015125 TaxID=3364938 RepID=UPI0036F8A7D9